MITTAEGVETEEQLQILRAEGCMQVQRFLFSKAIAAAEIPHLLRRLRSRVPGSLAHSSGCQICRGGRVCVGTPSCSMCGAPYISP